MIYLDHAATSLPKPEPVVMAVTAAMNCLGNSGRGAHSASLGASRMIYETREVLSDFFGGDGHSGDIKSRRSGGYNGNGA